MKMLRDRIEKLFATGEFRHAALLANSTGTDMPAESPNARRADARIKPRTSIAAARHIARAYFLHLQYNAPASGTVLDARRLPYDKKFIKAALSACLYASRDPQWSAQLREGYLLLSAWQPGVGETPVVVDEAGGPARKRLRKRGRSPAASNTGDSSDLARRVEREYRALLIDLQYLEDIQGAN